MKKTSKKCTNATVKQSVSPFCGSFIINLNIDNTLKDNVEI